MRFHRRLGGSILIITINLALFGCFCPGERAAAIFVPPNRLSELICHNGVYLDGNTKAIIVPAFAVDRGIGEDGYFTMIARARVIKLNDEVPGDEIESIMHEYTGALVVYHGMCVFIPGYKPIWIDHVITSGHGRRIPCEELTEKDNDERLIINKELDEIINGDNILVTKDNQHYWGMDLRYAYKGYAGERPRSGLRSATDQLNKCTSDERDKLAGFLKEVGGELSVMSGNPKSHPDGSGN